MNLYIVLLVLFIHYVADFLFQKSSWAENKSHSVDHLLKHVSAYSVFWFPTTFILFLGMTSWEISLVSSIIFTIVTFICHLLTDYFTSKVTSKMFKNKIYGTKLPNLGLFSIIGLDQLAHYFQLFILLEILISYIS